ncbi:MAG: hypothetical protein P1V51_24690 [Deltaproteobacteria bacterium]|nr:hypothetical protein [Deltaproteobacteria bacterium]
MRLISLAGVIAICGAPAFVSAAEGEEAPAVSIEILLEGVALQSEGLVESFATGEYEVRTRVLEIDDDGRPKMERNTIDRVVQKEGVPELTLVSAVEGGEDVRERILEERAERQEEAKKEAAEEGRDGKGRERGDFPNPFRGELQEKYRFEIAGPDRHVPGALKVTFEPKGKPDKKLFTGHAIIDAERRRMISLTARPSKYPFGLDEMFISVTFGEEGGRPILQRIFGKGRGGLPLMKRNFEFSSRFLQWKLPASPAPVAPPP